MTGAYLMGKDKDGKRSPMEVEYLTSAERTEKLGERSPEEILRWLDLTCETIVKLEDFLASEGYSKDESL